MIKSTVRSSGKGAINIENGTIRNDVIKERKQLTEKAYEKLKECCLLI